jgi:hypothetical protein
MINMIQNISQDRDSKRITRADLRNIRCAGGLSVYPGTTLYGASSNNREYLPLGHTILVYLSCIEGTGTNMAKTRWYWTSSSLYSQPNSTSGEATSTSAPPSHCVHWTSTPIDSNSIYPGLTIKNGEIKMIIEVMVKSRSWPDGKSASNDSGSKLFGFFLLKLPGLLTVNGATQDVRYYSSVVFIPNHGLFSVDRP